MKQTTKTRVKLTPQQRQRFIDTAHDTYHGAGQDVWGERTPSKAEFEDVVLDSMWDGLFAQPPWTRAEADLWQSLSRAQRRAIVLEVGP